MAVSSAQAGKWIAAPHKHLDCRYTFFWILPSEDNDKVVSNQAHARSVISERFCLGWATGVIRRGHTDANWACGERRSASSRAQLEHIAVTKKRKTVRIDARTPPLLLFGRGAVHEGGCKGADWLVGRPCNCLAPRPCRFPKEHGGQFSHLSPPPTSARVPELPRNTARVLTAARNCEQASNCPLALVARPLAPRTTASELYDVSEALRSGQVHRLDVKQRAPHTSLKTAALRMPVRACFIRASPNTLQPPSRSPSSSRPAPAVLI